MHGRKARAVASMQRPAGRGRPVHAWLQPRCESTSAPRFTNVAPRETDRGTHTDAQPQDEIV
eukprot:2638526-Prymnesium_polylepis.1